MKKSMWRWLYLGLSILGFCGCVNYPNFYEDITYFKAHQYREAFIRLKPVAEKGVPDAQYAVGYMYYYGEGVVEDRTQAWYWITRAAHAGQPDALEAAAILSKPKKETKH